MMEEEDDIDVDDSFSSGSPKKHKKTKKHKAKHDRHERHRKKKKHSLSSGHTGESDQTVTTVTSPQPSIKLKIKIGGQTLSSKSGFSSSVSVTAEDDNAQLFELLPVKKEKDAVNMVNQGPGTCEMSRSSSAASMQSWQTLKDDVFRTKRSDDDTSDEEREWLRALEAGELDDSGAVKKSKDPKLLTARQRSLIHGDREGLLELPSGYKNKEMTEEQLQRRQQRAKKRREQAHEKREKDKKQTLDRILKKQETSKSKKGKSGRRSQAPSFRYCNKPSKVTISVPQGYHFPFATQPARKPPPAQMCGITGCQNLKKYNCSKTGVPLCSLQCYKLNMAQNASHTLVTAVAT